MKPHSSPTGICSTWAEDLTLHDFWTQILSIKTVYLYVNG